MPAGWWHVRVRGSTMVEEASFPTEAIAERVYNSVRSKVTSTYTVSKLDPNKVVQKSGAGTR